MVHCSHGECVTLNFGATRFAFNLDAMLQEESEQQEAEVQRYQPSSLLYIL